MEPLLDLVPTPQGDVLVTTKTRFYFFFTQPRTYVMPHGFSEFGRRLGFQAIYRTTEPRILIELHAFFVASVAAGDFEALMLKAKRGVLELSPGQVHLGQYIAGFRA